MAARPISQSLGQVARQRANQIIAPQLAQQTSYGAHQNAVIRAFANSLLGKLQPIAGQVGGDYDAAIKQIGGLSANAAQYLSGQNPAAAQQALTSSVGAPPEQQAQATQALGNTFQGGAGVLAFQGGTIPGSQLAANKAAAMSQARALPAIGALAGQQSLSSALWQQGQERSKLEAQRPGLVQQEEQQIQENTLAKQKLAQQEKAAKATAKYRSAQIDLGYTKVAQSAADKAADRGALAAYHATYLDYLDRGLDVRAATAAASQAADQARIDIARANATTSRITARTGQIRADTAATQGQARIDQGAQRIAISERRAAAYIKAQEANAKTKKGGLSRKDRLKYQGLALTLADQAFNGTPESKPGEGDDLPAITFSEAILEGQKEGLPMEILMPALKRIYGTKEAAKLRAVINALPGG